MFAYCDNNPVNGWDPTGEAMFECCPHGDCHYCKEESKYQKALNNVKMSVAKDQKKNRDTVYIHIVTYDVVYKVGTKNYLRFCSDVYNNSVDYAKSHNVPEENLMSVFHINWELSAHVVAYHLEIENANITDLNIEETPSSMLRRALE